jgi:hypothetical protein
VCILLYDEQLV